MRTMLIFLLCVLSTATFAADVQGWLVGNNEISFTESSFGGLVNPSCLKRSNCQAITALKNKRAGVVGEGGRHPASEVCRRYYKGEVVIAFRGHASQSFCHFQDDSYASLDGIIK